MKNKSHDRNEKILNYIETNNLLNNFENLEVSETYELQNIYWDWDVVNKQHFVYSKKRSYLFHFNGFDHNISVTVNEVDRDTAIMEDDNIFYRDPSNILQFLKEDIYKDSNIIPFLCILLNIDWENVNAFDREKQKEQINEHLSEIESKISILNEEKRKLKEELNTLCDNNNKNYLDDLYSKML